MEWKHEKHFYKLIWYYMFLTLYMCVFFVSISFLPNWHSFSTLFYIKSFFFMNLHLTMFENKNSVSTAVVPVNSQFFFMTNLSNWD